MTNCNFPGLNTMTSTPNGASNGNQTAAVMSSGAHWTKIGLHLGLMVVGLWFTLLLLKGSGRDDLNPAIEQQNTSSSLFLHPLLQMLTLVGLGPSLTNVTCQRIELSILSFILAWSCLVLVSEWDLWRSNSSSFTDAAGISCMTPAGKGTSLTRPTFKSSDQPSSTPPVAATLSSPSAVQAIKSLQSPSSFGTGFIGSIPSMKSPVSNHTTPFTPLSAGRPPLFSSTSAASPSPRQLGKVSSATPYTSATATPRAPSTTPGSGKLLSSPYARASTSSGVDKSSPLAKQSGSSPQRNEYFTAEPMLRGRISPALAKRTGLYPATAAPAAPSNLTGTYNPFALPFALTPFKPSPFGERLLSKSGNRRGPSSLALSDWNVGDEMLDDWAELVRCWFASALRECLNDVAATAPLPPSIGSNTTASQKSSKLHKIASALSAGHKWSAELVFNRLKALAASRDLSLFSPQPHVFTASSHRSSPQRHHLAKHRETVEGLPCDTVLLYHFFGEYLSSLYPPFTSKFMGTDATDPHLSLLLDMETASDSKAEPSQPPFPVVLLEVHGKLYRPGTRRDSLFKAVALFAYYIKVTAAGYVGVVPLDSRSVGLDIGRGASGTGRVFDRHFAEVSPKSKLL